MGSFPFVPFVHFVALASFRTSYTYVDIYISLKELRNLETSLILLSPSFTTPLRRVPALLLLPCVPNNSLHTYVPSDPPTFPTYRLLIPRITVHLYLLLGVDVLITLVCFPLPSFFFPFAHFDSLPSYLRGIHTHLLTSLSISPRPTRATKPVESELMQRSDARASRSFSLLI